MSYNKKAKMIKIEQYNQDPKRVGHELMISTPTTRGPKQPRISLDERIANVIAQTVPGIVSTIVTDALKPIVARLDKIETRLGTVETRLENVETTLTTVIKLNDLKTA
ncbi:MAG: hypothetical protein LBT17_03890 [Mycoplasmataceae bacterium]|jgi:hypothetical protein|nr:hypothetical protein [Mycoplasmataceae bacterium]